MAMQVGEKKTIFAPLPLPNTLPLITKSVQWHVQMSSLHTHCACKLDIYPMQNFIQYQFGVSSSCIRDFCTSFIRLFFKFNVGWDLLSSKRRSPQELRRK